MDPEQELRENLTKALNAEIPAATEVAPGEEEGTEPLATASEGDTLTEEEQAAAAAKAAEDAKEPDPVPYGRFKEKVDEVSTYKTKTEQLEAQNRELMSDLSQLAKNITSGEKITTTEKVEAREDIAALVKSGEITPEEGVKFNRLLDAANVARAGSSDAKLSAQEKLLQQQAEEIKTLKNVVFGDKDQAALDSAVKKFDGIVTKDQLQAKLKEMIKSGDPDRVHMANNSSYDKIIQTEFFSEILKAETDKVLEGKPKVAPKVATGGKEKGNAPKKPAAKEIIYDPSNPKAFEEALRAEARAKANSAGE